MIIVSSNDTEVNSLDLKLIPINPNFHSYQCQISLSGTKEVVSATFNYLWHGFVHFLLLYELFVESIGNNTSSAIDCELHCTHFTINLFHKVNNKVD